MRSRSMQVLDKAATVGRAVCAPGSANVPARRELRLKCSAALAEPGAPGASTLSRLAARLIGGFVRIPREKWKSRISPPVAARKMMERLWAQNAGFYGTFAQT